jgi:hypothetical protein
MAGGMMKLRTIIILTVLAIIIVAVATLVVLDSSTAVRLAATPIP